MKNIFTYSTAFVLGLALVATPEADAQQFSKRKQYNSVGFSLNAMNYFGDVTPDDQLYQLALRCYPPGCWRFHHPPLLSRVFRAGLALSYGRISGDDALAADQNDPNAQFPLQPEHELPQRHSGSFGCCYR